MIKASDIVCTAHQPNFLPGCSVMDRVRRADLVIWLDGAQYERHSFVNRNRFSDGSWMTVPVSDDQTFAPIGDVRIADPGGRQREKIARTLEMTLGRLAAPFATELRRPYPKLVGLNLALLDQLMKTLGIHTAQRHQTFIDIEPPISVVSDDDTQIALVRDRYADLAARLGATVWLSGPGRHHGDVERFAARGIRIEYTQWAGANPCALEYLRPQAVAA